MSMQQQQTRALAALFMITAASTTFAQDPLPSWNDGAAKSAIVAFVDNVTDEKSPGFVPVPERIATFDNDGCLWSEQPLYFQGLFAFDQIRNMAPDHPDWNTKEPFKSVLAGDVTGLLATGPRFRGAPTTSRPVSDCSSTTRIPGASSPTTAIRTWAGSTRRWTPHRNVAGWSST